MEGWARYHFWIGLRYWGVAFASECCIILCFVGGSPSQVNVVLYCVLWGVAFAGECCIIFCFVGVAFTSECGSLARANTFCCVTIAWRCDVCTSNEQLSSFQISSSRMRACDAQVQTGQGLIASSPSTSASSPSEPLRSSPARS